MASWLIGVIVVAALFVIVLVALTAVRMQRRRTLRRQFGPEYDRTVDERGRRKAENELAQRAERREQVDLKPLAPEARRLYAASWEQVQARFVDAPADAVQEADVLVAKVMRDCGYPVDGFDDRSDFVSVDHPHLVEDYRAAHRTAVADTGGTVSTEDRRQAMVHFRSLFEALLDDQHDMTDRRTG